MAENSNLAIRDNPERHRLEVNFGDDSIAFAQYHVTQGRIVFTHTQVPKAHEGQGIGSALIRYALASARERGLKVVPVCPFFADYFKNHAEEQDLLDPESRAKLGLA